MIIKKQIVPYQIILLRAICFLIRFPAPAEAGAGWSQETSGFLLHRNDLRLYLRLPIAEHSRSEREVKIREFPGGKFEIELRARFPTELLFRINQCCKWCTFALRPVVPQNRDNTDLGSTFPCDILEYFAEADSGSLRRSRRDGRRMTCYIICGREVRL